MDIAKIKSNILSALKPNKAWFFVFVFILLAIYPFSSNAADGLNEFGFWIIQGFGWLIMLFVSLLGQLLVVVIDVLITVAQYNAFIYAPPVVEGWIIVRDLCNMFFILILLIIAFGTILHRTDYSIRGLFPKVILAAIMINFSKLICGIFIDFSQVIMLTFVAGFKDVAGGNFINLLGLSEMLKLDTSALDNNNSAGANLSLFSLLTSYILALLFSLVAFIVMFALLMTLVIRMVFIWIYIILSPFAYMLSAIPAGKKYSGMWWSKFSSEVIVGPILAFFIWLSLATLGSFSANTQSAFDSSFGFADIKNEPNAEIKISNTQAGSSGHILRFIVSLGLLMGGLVVAKSTSAQAASAAGKGYSRIMAGAGWMKKKGRQAARATGRKAASVAKYGGIQTLGLAKGIDTSLARKLSGDQTRAGYVTSAAQSMRYNVFSKDAWKRHADTVFGRSYNKVAHEATTRGEYTDERGVRYKPNSEGEYRAVRKDANGNEVADGDKLMVKGRAVKAMSNFSKDFYEGRHGTAGISRADVGRLTAEEKKLNDNIKKYDGLSDAELFSRANSTTDPDQQRAIYMSLMNKGAFKPKDSEDIRKATQLFSDKPELAKKFMEKAKEKSAWSVYSDLDNPGQVEALTRDIRQGKVKASLQAVEGIDPNYVQKFHTIAAAALGAEGYGRDIRTLDASGSPADKNMVAAANIGMAQSRENSLLERLTDEKFPDLLAKGIARGLTQAEAENEARRAIQDEVLNDRQSLSYRSNAAILTNSLINPFTYNTPQGPVINQDQVRKFVENASARDITNINPYEKGFDKVANGVLSGLSYAKFNSAFRDGSNPENVAALAQLKGLNHDPEAEKYRMVINSVNVNSDHSSANEMISKIIGQSQDIFSNPGAEKTNTQLLNDFRTHLQAKANSAEFFADDGKGKLTAEAAEKMNNELRSFIAARMAHIGNGGTPATAPNDAGSNWNLRTSVT